MRHFHAGITTGTPGEKQVDKKHYRFECYCYFDRWASYWYQLREVLAAGPKTMLEVGVGDGVLRDYVKQSTPIRYANIDVAEDLRPDTVGSVLAMPFGAGAFDMVCAFEVLEHLPFEQFEPALAEMSRVSSGKVIISVPHFGPAVKWKCKLPFLSEFTFAFKVPFPIKHVFNGQHYWEIGKRGYSLSTVRGVLRRRFHIEKEFVPFENQYHHFFVLQKLP